MNEFNNQHQGWIEVITGPMFSGKSSELIRRVRRALFAQKRVQVFKSALDDRYEGVEQLCTHDGICLPTLPIRKAEELFDLIDEATEIVAIDEIQFLEGDVVGVVNTLANQGKIVICCGLDMTFAGHVFSFMGELMAIAERVDKLSSICAQCGANASRTQRLIKGKPAPADGSVILVGSADSYEARCRRCHEVPPASSSL